MTTAHRPTWKAAVGQSSGGGWTAGGAPTATLSVLDMPGHTKLKVRKGPQVVDRQKALKESLLKLQEAEKEATKRVLQRPPVDETIEEEGRLKLLKQTAEVDEKAIQEKYDDGDASADDDDSGGGWSDVDKVGGDDLDASSDDDDDDDDDDEDEEAALQAELAKIRAEREALKRKEEEEAAAEQEEKLEEAALMGNPLLVGGGEGSVGGTGKLKRRWNEDVVFRNQAKGEPEIKKRFINDTVRNDFHRRFLNKFIR